MNRTLAVISIISISAFAGNMINIGLSYGIHWLSLDAMEFMTTFKIDFPLLLGPTVLTLLPAFIGTLLMYFYTKKDVTLKRYWSISLVCLLIVNLQTVVYHLPVNLGFMDHKYSAIEAASKLKTWIFLHWIRVIVTIVAAVYAINGFEKMKNKN